MKVIGVIPARYESTRLPGKPLMKIKGKPMIQWVYERAKASNLDEVIVATDDERIRDAVTRFGGEAILTSKDCKNGTERLFEIGRKTIADYYINIQGDEPLIEPKDINEFINLLQPGCIFTMVSRLKEKDKSDPGTVKAHLGPVSEGSWSINQFSRSPVYGKASRFMKHIGIYGFPADILENISTLAPTQNEKDNDLEQIRWMDNGYSIRSLWINNEIIGVDTQEDLDKVIQICEEKNLS